MDGSADDLRSATTQPKLAKFIGEAKSLHIDVLPPDINQASSEFTASKDGIRFAMAGIKGVGHGVVEHDHRRTRPKRGVSEPL